MFSKLEVLIRNIVRTTEYKQRARIRRAYEKLKANRQFKNQVRDKKRVLVYLTFEAKIKKLAQISANLARRSLKQRLMVWKTNVRVLT